ncbi:ATP-binding protein [Pseudoalteromonas sp. Of7M-16]|uniref:ATP-binding protein n=1 Tax=Pseudoalteromonas sp. Of7M-16 TaxID=2917756 RepID=UPI001EF66FA6|nr:ATP-binding protein [Pseudoalteromonas sp. Of7M-16]MCG7551738.1 ATP-binding protein [Pseudoalteromonas sp. Of7M-16]
MYKAFLLLWLVVFVPIFFLIIPHDFNPLPKINDASLKSFFVKTYSGTFYLLDKQLSITPENQWRKEVAQLSNEFGYTLTLLPLEQATDVPLLQLQLEQGEFAFSNGEPELLLRRVEDSQWVISMALDDSVEETLSRVSRGPVYMMSQAFDGVPVEQWPAVLDELRKHFHYALSMVPINELPLSEEKMERLNKGELVWVAQPDGHLLFYYLLPNGSLVLQAGALPVLNNAAWIYLAFGIVFILVVSIGMFLWVYPLWRDLNRLDATATDFGNGFLDSRAVLAKNTVIARLGQSFNVMADRIEKLILGHKELTNAIAHDLRTPLYRLRFAIDMLDDATEQERYKYRDSIQNSIDDLDNLISQTLTLSRYSRAMDITHFAKCHLAGQIEREIEQLRQQFSNLEIDYTVDKALIKSQLFVDRRALLRALNNLMSNASRFANSKINVCLRLVENSCLLIVEDDGPGIEQNQWARIFNPFVQLQNIERDSNSGHGLGLAIVQQVALWHKGEAKVGRSPLGGAYFELRWPLEITT